FRSVRGSCGPTLRRLRPWPCSRPLPGTGHSTPGEISLDREAGNVHWTVRQHFKAGTAIVSIRKGSQLMARDTMDVRPVESVEDLADYIAEGEKPPSQWRIGTEHEKFPFHIDGNRPVAYEGSNGIRALLEGLQRVLGWEPIIDAGKVIGLVGPTGQGAISLEPGGQFELSGAPLETIHQT